MKTKQELLSMLYSKLAELQDGRIKQTNPTVADQIRIELSLLYDILGDDVPEEYWEQIEKETNEEDCTFEVIYDELDWTYYDNGVLRSVMCYINDRKVETFVKWDEQGAYVENNGRREYVLVNNN